MKLFNMTRVDSMKGEKISLGFSTCCVILGNLIDLDKFFKPLSLNFLIYMVEIAISSIQSCCKNNYVCVYTYIYFT